MTVKSIDRRAGNVGFFVCLQYDFYLIFGIGDKTRVHVGIEPCHVAFNFFLDLFEVISHRRLAC